MKLTTALGSFLLLFLVGAAQVHAQPVDEGYQDDFFGEDFGQPEPEPYDPSPPPETKPYVDNTKDAPVTDYAPAPEPRPRHSGRSKFARAGTKILTGWVGGSYRTLESDSSDIERSYVDVLLSPQIGYFVAEGFAISVGPTYMYSGETAKDTEEDSEDTTSYSVFGLGVDFRGFLKINSNFFFNIGAALSVAKGTSTNESSDSDFSYETDTFAWGVAAGPGLTWTFGANNGGFVNLNLIGQYVKTSSEATLSLGSEWGSDSTSESERKEVSFGVASGLGVYF